LILSAFEKNAQIESKLATKFAENSFLAKKTFVKDYAMKVLVIFVTKPLFKNVDVQRFKEKLIVMS